MAVPPEGATTSLEAVTLPEKESARNESAEVPCWSTEWFWMGLPRQS